MKKEEIEKIYLTDFETEPIGDGNPYNRCIYCGISEPQINGNIFNHSETCEYRIKKLEEFGFQKESSLKKIGGLGKKIKESLTDITNITLSEFDFIEIEKTLEKIGYKINSIEVTVSIPPRAAFEIDIFESNVDKDIKEEVVKSSGLLMKAIILALDNAIVFQEKIKFKHKKLEKMILDISLIPNVRFVYS